ncbi:hypothetical protein RF11_03669 [Thelohanellus kitauei]|uniref:Uncharacterized protein n=1 Tax=Thelohanellus kitauei TaxID=669202 RepID=A0A0C2JSM7_THEKT|nr:hypothetical protein RF11_03669 [Thelohanellus kitauei]
MLVEVYRVDIHISMDKMPSDEQTYHVKCFSNTCDRNFLVSKLSQEPGVRSVYFISLWSMNRMKLLEKFRIKLSHGYIEGDFFVVGRLKYARIKLSATQTVTPLVKNHVNVDPFKIPSTDLKTNQFYRLYFFVRGLTSQMFIKPRIKNSFQFPSVSTIRFSLLYSNGTELKNPPPIVDFIRTRIVESIDGSHSKIYITRSLRDHRLKIEIFDYNGKSVGRSIYSLATDAFAETDSNDNDFTVKFIQVKTIDVKLRHNFLISVPEVSKSRTTGFLLTTSEIHECRHQGQPALVIEKMWESHVAYIKSLCIMEASPNSKIFYMSTCPLEMHKACKDESKKKRE